MKISTVYVQVNHNYSIICHYLKIATYMPQSLIPYDKPYLVHNNMTHTLIYPNKLLSLILT